MKKFLQQTKAVYLKNLAFHRQSRKFLQLLWIPFICGLIRWLLLLQLLGSVQIVDRLTYLLYLPFSICGTTRIYLMLIVGEKKNRQKENQLIMELSLSSYNAGWILSSLTWTYISALFYIFIVRSFQAVFAWENFSFSSVGKMCIQFLFYSFATVGQMFFISSLFFDIIRALEAYCTIILFLYLLFLQVIMDLRNIFTQIAISISPQNLILYYYFHKDVTYISTLIIFFVQGIVGIILYIYLDQIILNENGVSKSPFFIFGCLKNKNTVVEPIQNIGLSQQIQLDQKLIDIQDIQEQAQGQEEAEFLLYKYLSQQKNIMENLFLLGHNGAGKSTTINMICGLIKKDSGNVIIDGLDIDQNLSEIRKIVGYCPQKNIIYDDFTVVEHLNFYGRLKLLNPTQLSERIDYILANCDLQQEKRQIGRYLSGGGKRKLCLAIALIGDPKILLLDEPTADLDPVSRQQIWSILRTIKQDKCIILTTHY